MDVAARLEVVEAENDMLRERILQLEAALFGDRAPPIEFRLTSSEGAIFGMLLQRPLCTKEMLMVALYHGFDKDAADPKIVDVFVCKMRKKLKPFGIEIATRWGQGYEIPSASKIIAREMMGETRVAA